MTDLVLFAGPVQLKPPFQQIDWLGRQTVVIPIAGSGSAYFASLAESFRDGQGRILPRLLAKYAPKIGSFDKLALCAYSAGHGMMNQIGQVPADAAMVSAVVLDDACFIGDNRPDPPGLVNWAARGASGKGLFVATSSRGDGATYQNGTDSVGRVWRAAGAVYGGSPKAVAPRAPVAVGSWQQLGDTAFWGDIPTLTHGEHHDYAPVVWQAYLAPYLAGDMFVAGDLLASLFPLYGKVRGA